jgi:hypothetical protein
LAPYDTASALAANNIFLPLIETCEPIFNKPFLPFPFLLLL